MGRENLVSGVVVDAAIKVHRALGPGLLESVYEAALAHELGKRGVRVERQVAIDVVYEDLCVPAAFRADLIVEGLVLVELKSIEKVAPVHKKQTLTYMKLADYRVGLLLNFGERLMKDGVTRLVHNLPNEPQPQPLLCASAPLREPKTNHRPSLRGTT